MRLWYPVNGGKQNGYGSRWTEKAGRHKEYSQKRRGGESCMTPYESYNLLFSALGLTGQYIGLGLIFYGIHSMRKGTERREQESIRRHTENMEEIRNSREENMSALKALIEGQKVLIERTRG